MPKKVTANGKTFTFDDNTTDEQIAEAIDEYFNGKAKEEVKKKASSPVSTKPSLTLPSGLTPSKEAPTTASNTPRKSRFAVDEDVPLPTQPKVRGDIQSLPNVLPLSEGMQDVSVGQETKARKEATKKGNIERAAIKREEADVKKYQQQQLNQTLQNFNEAYGNDYKRGDIRTLDAIPTEEKVGVTELAKNLRREAIANFIAKENEKYGTNTQMESDFGEKFYNDMIDDGQYEVAKDDNGNPTLIKAPSGIERASNFVSNFIKGGTSLVSGSVKAIGELGNYLDRETFSPNAKIEDNPFYKLGKWIEDGSSSPMERKFPQLKEDFLSADLGSGFGQIAGMMVSLPSGVAKEGIKLINNAAIKSVFRNVLDETAKQTLSAPSILGTLTMASGEYEQAYQAAQEARKYTKQDYIAANFGGGKSTEDLAAEYDYLKSKSPEDIGMELFLKTIPSGTIEMVSVSRLFKRLNESTRGSVAQTINKFGVGAFEGGAEGFIQESLQTAYSNATAQQTYDRTRDILEGVVRSGEAGGFVQGLLSAMINALGGKMKAAVTPNQKAIIQKAIDEVTETIDNYEENINALEKQVNSPNVAVQMPTTEKKGVQQTVEVGKPYYEKDGVVITKAKAEELIASGDTKNLTIAYDPKLQKQLEAQGGVSKGAEKKTGAAVILPQSMPKNQVVELAKPTTNETQTEAQEPIIQTNEGVAAVDEPLPSKESSVAETVIGETVQPTEGEVGSGVVGDVELPNYGKTVDTKMGKVDLVIEPNDQSENKNSIKVSAYDADGNTLGFSSAVVDAKNKTLTVKVSQIKDKYQRNGIYSKIIDEYETIAKDKGLKLERELEGETQASKDFWNNREQSLPTPTQQGTEQPTVQKNEAFTKLEQPTVSENKGELILEDKKKDILDEVTDEKIGEKEYQNFSIDFEDGARAFGKVEDGVAFISGINAPKKDGKVVRGTKTYERVLQKLKEKGINTVTIGLQSTDSENAIDKLVAKGVLINARGFRGVSTNQKPTTFDIGNFDQKATTEKVTTTSALMQEPELPKGEKIVTVSGLSESEKANLIAERKKTTELTEQEKVDNVLAEMSNRLKAKGLKPSERKDLRAATKQKVLSENARLGYERYRYDVDSGVRVRSKIRGKEGYRYRTLRPIYKDSGGRAIVENGRDIIERNNPTLRDNFDAIADAIVTVDSDGNVQSNILVPDASNQKSLSGSQLLQAIEDVYNGINSQNAQSLLDTLEKAIAENDFPIKNNELGYQYTLNDLLGVENVELTQPIDEETLLSWLDEESQLEPEIETIISDNIENILYDYPTETEIEIPISETKPTEQKRSTQKAEPTTQPTKQEEGTVNKSQKEVTLQTKAKKDAEQIINGTAIFERFSPQEQRGIAEGGRYHAEATLILGRSEEASREPETQEAEIEQYAKDNGIWIEDTDASLREELGEPLSELEKDGNQEATVWLNKDGVSVTKSQNTAMYGFDLQNKLDGITLHNTYFPEAPLKVIGFGRDKNGLFQVIVEQTFIKGTKLTPEEIRDYLNKIGFEKEIDNNQFTDADNTTIVEDIHTGNAIKTPNGNIIVIDPIMYLNTPEQGYGGTRISTNKVTPIQSQLKTEQDVEKNIEGVASKKREGEEPIKAEPVKTTSGEKTTTSRDVQSYEEKARKIADKILKAELPDWLKIDDENVSKQGVGSNELKRLLADAVIEMGKLLDKGVDFKEAVKKAVSELVKAQGEDNREAIEKGFENYYQEQSKIITASSVFVEEPLTSAKNAEVERVLSEFGLEELPETERQTRLAATKLAEDTIQDWKDNGTYGSNINSILKRAYEGKASALDQDILVRHLADLRTTARATKNRNTQAYNDLLAKIMDASYALNRIGTEFGRGLQARKDMLKGSILDSVLDVEIDMMKNEGVDFLTEVQKQEAEERYNKLKEAYDKEKALREEAEAVVLKMQAEAAILADKKKTPTKKKTAEEYKAERKNIKKSIKDLWDNTKADGNLYALPIPLPLETIAKLRAISPKVAELVKSYIDQTADITFEKVRDFVKSELSEEGIDLDNYIITGLIAGEYKEKKPTKNELMQQVYLVRKEAELLNELDRLMELGEPKTERDKRIKNKRLSDLRKQIEEVKKNLKVGKYSDEAKFETAIKQRIAANKKAEEALVKKINDKDYSDEPKKVSILDNKELQEKHKDLYNEYLQSVIAKEKAFEQYEHDKLKDVYETRSKVQKALGYLAYIPGTYTGVKAIFDASFVLVQNVIPSLANPILAAKTIKEMYTLSAKDFEEMMAKLHKSEYWDIIQKSGLAIYEPTSANYELRNELYGGSKNLLNKDITIKGKKYSIGKYFERQSAIYSNTFRLEYFMKEMLKLEKAGKTIDNALDDYKALAKAVNSMTAYGEVPKALKNQETAAWVNAFIWSTRLLSSTFQLTGVSDIGAGLRNLSIRDKEKKVKGFYQSLTPEARKLVLQETRRALLVAVASMAAIVAISRADDDDENDVEAQFNPFEPNFFSISSGNDVFAPMGRLTDVVSVFAGVVEQIAAIMGIKAADYNLKKERAVGDTFFRKYVRGKARPDAGLAYDYFLNKGKNYYTGEDITLKDLRPFPMSLDGFIEDAAKDEGWRLAVKTIYKVAGGQARLKEYEKKKKSKQNKPRESM